ncbi:Fe-S cluster assembly protein SufB [Candidatus Woesearchaeota archaeon]|nr:Fe-S cluster assembly protein SufB [Candidatus Woesearchaeota archaeon]
MNEELTLLNNDYEKKYGFKVEDKPLVKLEGLNEETVKTISKLKNEASWMTEKRLQALKIFTTKPMPTWGGDLKNVNFDNVTYYLRSNQKVEDNWENVPEEIKQTFERLGIPEAERKFLAGSGAQFESESVYHKIREDLSKVGVIFCDMDTALKEYPEIVKENFGRIVPAGDNKFAALNTACWSGGSFIYVPKNVKVTAPLQAYFRINAKNMGQFERTLIIADEGAEVTYYEGCTSPVYSSDSLHAAVVELVAKKNAKIRYVTIQNWSSNVYNLVTKRAFAYENATVEWIDGNIGSKLTMKYPSVYLMEKNAKANILSVAIAGKNQHQDAGGKVIHLAPNTTSRIISKSVSKDGGRSSYRGFLKVGKNATNVKATVRCDALLLDEFSRSDTYPTMQIEEKDAVIAHEATVGKIGDEQLFYLTSRGLTETEAMSMIVLGFISEFTKELPMEYAIELNKLIHLEMENAIG